MNCDLRGNQQDEFLIYNSLGNQVSISQISGDNNSLTINTAGLPKGIYICKINASQSFTML
jgi:hypothetical protein